MNNINTPTASLKKKKIKKKPTITQAKKIIQSKFDKLYLAIKSLEN